MFWGQAMYTHARARLFFFFKESYHKAIHSNLSYLGRYTALCFESHNLKSFAAFRNNNISISITMFTNSLSLCIVITTTPSASQSPLGLVVWPVSFESRVCWLDCKTKVQVANWIWHYMYLLSFGDQMAIFQKILNHFATMVWRSGRKSIDRYE